MLLGLVLISFFTIKTQAQTAAIVFRGTTEFQVHINNIKQHDAFTNGLKINQLKGNQPYAVKINAATPNPLLRDTLPQDTAYKIPFASYYKLENYEGRIGCPFPIKEAEQAKIKNVILSESLEESKLEQAKITIEKIDSVCVLVNQLKEIILLFQFEETRLNFMKYIAPHVFDRDNYEKLYPAFNFEDSKSQIKALLKKD